MMDGMKSLFGKRSCVINEVKRLNGKRDYVINGSLQFQDAPDQQTNESLCRMLTVTEASSTLFGRGRYGSRLLWAPA